MSRKITKILSIFLCLCLFFEQSGFAQVASQLDISGRLTTLHSSLFLDTFRPVHLRYLAFDRLHNRFNLLLDKGDAQKNEKSKELFKDETQKIFNYFLIGISLPNQAFWVNLRPDSPQEIMDPALEQTDIGRVLLEADVQLKKDTARFTSPATREGRDYWDRLYSKAEELFGYDSVTIPTLVRPWIVPGEIIIREAQDNAYIYKATLKVCLEEDYLKDSKASGVQAASIYNFSDPRLKELNEYSSRLIKEIIIPKLTREINTSKRYASLRQVYYSLILSQWFKGKFDSQAAVNSYAGLINSKNLVNLTSKTPWSKDIYFSQYRDSFAQGEYNLQESHQTPFGQTMRSYMSGGIDFGSRAILPIMEAGKISAANNQPPTSLMPMVTATYEGGQVLVAEAGNSSPIVVSSAPAGERIGLNNLKPTGWNTAEESPRSLAEMEQTGFNASDLILVHRTNYLPNNGMVETTMTATKGRVPRDTVHFSVNHPVSGHLGGNWDEAAYTVLIPLTSISKAKIECFNLVDTWVRGDLMLPEGAVVLGVGPLAENVSLGKAKYIQIAASNQENVNRMINELGYAAAQGGMWSWFSDSLAWTERQNEFAKKETLDTGAHSNLWSAEFEEAMLQENYYVSDQGRIIYRLFGAEMVPQLLAKAPFFTRVAFVNKFGQEITRKFGVKIWAEFYESFVPKQIRGLIGSATDALNVNWRDYGRWDSAGKNLVKTEIEDIDQGVEGKLAGQNIPGEVKKQWVALAQSAPLTDKMYIWADGGIRLWAKFIQVGNLPEGVNAYLMRSDDPNLPANQSLINESTPFVFFTASGRDVVYPDSRLIVVMRQGINETLEQQAIFLETRKLFWENELVSQGIKSSAMIQRRANALAQADLMRIAESLNSPAQAASSSIVSFPQALKQDLIMQNKGRGDEVEKVEKIWSGKKKLLFEIGCSRADLARAIAEKNPGIGVIATDMFPEQSEGNGGRYSAYTRQWQEGKLKAQESPEPDNLAIVRAEFNRKLLKEIPDSSLDYILLVNPERMVMDLLLGNLSTIAKKLKPGGQLILKPFDEFSWYRPRIDDAYSVAQINRSVAHFSRINEIWNRLEKGLNLTAPQEAYLKDAGLNLRLENGLSFLGVDLGNAEWSSFMPLLHVHKAMMSVWAKASGVQAAVSSPVTVSNPAFAPGRNTAIQMLENDPQAWVVFSDMMKLRLRNYYYGENAADYFIDDVVKMTVKYLSQYRGTAYRIGDRADEIAMVLPGNFSGPEINDILLGLQTELKVRYGAIVFAQLTGEFDQNALERLRGQAGVKAIQELQRFVGGPAGELIREKVLGVLFEKSDIHAAGETQLKSLLKKAGLNAATAKTESVLPPYLPCGAMRSDLGGSAEERLDEALIKAEQYQGIGKDHKLFAGVEGIIEFRQRNEAKNSLFRDTAQEDQVKNKLAEISQGVLQTQQSQVRAFVRRFYGERAAELVSIEEQYGVFVRQNLYDILEYVTRLKNVLAKTFIIRGPPDNFYVVNVGEEKGKIKWQVALVKQTVLTRDESIAKSFEMIMHNSRRGEAQGEYGFKVINDYEELFGHHAGNQLIALDSLYLSEGFQALALKTRGILGPEEISQALETAATGINQVISPKGFSVDFEATVINSDDFAAGTSVERELEILELLSSARNSSAKTLRNVRSYRDNRDNLGRVLNETAEIEAFRAQRAGRELDRENEIFMQQWLKQQVPKSPQDSILKKGLLQKAAAIREASIVKTYLAGNQEIIASDMQVHNSNPGDLEEYIRGQVLPVLKSRLAELDYEQLNELEGKIIFINYGNDLVKGVIWELFKDFRQNEIRPMLEEKQKIHFKEKVVFFKQGKTLTLKGHTLLIEEVTVKMVGNGSRFFATAIDTTDHNKKLLLRFIKSANYVDFMQELKNLEIFNAEKLSFSAPYQDKYNQGWVIATQFFPGPRLGDYVEQLQGEPLIKYLPHYLDQIIKVGNSVVKIHQKLGVPHDDLNFENIIVSGADETFMIIDFEFANKSALDLAPLEYRDVELLAALLAMSLSQTKIFQNPFLLGNLPQWVAVPAGKAKPEALDLSFASYNLDTSSVPELNRLVQIVNDGLKGKLSLTEFVGELEAYQKLLTGTASSPVGATLGLASESRAGKAEMLRFILEEAAKKNQGGYSETLNLELERYIAERNLLDPDVALTEQAIKDIHSIVSKEDKVKYGAIEEAVPVQDRGVYRQIARDVGNVTLAADKIPEQMRDFVNWLALTEGQATDTEMFSAQAFLKFITIHPFINGNGRLARFLINLLLLRKNRIPVLLTTYDFAFLNWSMTTYKRQWMLANLIRNSQDEVKNAPQYQALVDQQNVAASSPVAVAVKSPDFIAAYLKERGGWISQPGYFSWLGKVNRLVKSGVEPGKPVLVYYYGIGGGRSPYVSGVEMIDIISPLLATDFNRMVSFDKGLPGFNLFKIAVLKELKIIGLKPGDVSFEQLDQNSFKCSFNYQNKLRVVTVTYNQDAKKAYPQELEQGYNVLYSRGMPAVFPEMEKKVKDRLLNVLLSPGGLIVMESYSRSPSSISGFERVDLGDTSWSDGRIRRLDVLVKTERPGGIDFRVLPILTQQAAIGQVMPNQAAGLNFGNRVFNFDQELIQIRNMLNSGIVPSSQRIKDYVQACYGSGESVENIDKILSCIAYIFRLEEDRVEQTDPQFKELVMLLESNQSAEELKLNLAGISFSEKEFKLIKAEK